MPLAAWLKQGRDSKSPPFKVNWVLRNHLQPTAPLLLKIHFTRNASTTFLGRLNVATLTDRQTRLSQRAARTQVPAISGLVAKPLEDPEIISLAAGLVDHQSLPFEEVREVLNRIFDSNDTAKNSLQYGTTIGYNALRKSLAERLESKGVAAPVNPNHIAVTSGSQQLLFLASEVLLDPGDIVLVEDPTYFVYLGALEAIGARVIGVATDNDGLIPEALEQRLEELKAADEISRVKILYLLTYYQNPRGTSIPWSRREKIYEIVQRYTADSYIYILEDAAYVDLRYDGPEIPLMKTLDPDNERIILAMTFSKGFSPGLRIGYGYLPEELVQPVLSQKGNQDFGTSNFAQYIAYHALASGYFDEHGKIVRERYRRKRDVMLKVIREEFPKEVSYIEPDGGLYVWATLPEGISTSPGSKFFDEALARKVIYVPGAYCYAQEPGITKPDNQLRLCYGYIEEQPMIEGLRRLAAALKTCV